MTINYEIDIQTQLKQALMKENIQNDHDLSTLDPEFYSRIKDSMVNLSKEEQEKVQSMMNTLCRKRQGKIVLLANVLKMTPELEQKLTLEERELFQSIHLSFEEFRRKCNLI